MNDDDNGLVVTQQKPNLIARAQVTLANLSSSGELTPEQATNFVALCTFPFPPSKPRFWQVWRFPIYLYRWLKFRKANKRWEKRLNRKNPALQLRVIKLRDTPEGMKKF